MELLTFSRCSPVQNIFQLTDPHNKCDRDRLYPGLNLTLYSDFRHVTHRILQERNAEGQTLLAIIEVNRCDKIQHQSDAYSGPSPEHSRLPNGSICWQIYSIFMNINFSVQSQPGNNQS